MTEEIYKPSYNFSKNSLISDFETYEQMYKRSIQDPDGFWSEIALKNFYWKTPFIKASHYNFDLRKGAIDIKWFEDGKTNITYNCVDRHLDKNANRVALIFEGNDPSNTKKLTYRELHEQVCKFANVLKSQGVKKGDRVSIYMPMIVEAVVAVLACARIGAVHSVVFGGFSSESLSDRIQDSECNVVVTADGCMRGDKFINLKEIADRALDNCAKNNYSIKSCIVFQNLPDSAHTMKPGRDFDWSDLMAKASSTCEIEWMNAEDPLFILYTSGSTGKPKGVLHTTGGYMVFSGTTFKYIFDYHPDDIFWCTADVGWVTGHSYIVYGPLLNAATQVIFEGIPMYPDAGRFWEVTDKHKVTIFYTAPTAIRALMAKGDSFVKKYSRKSLRVLGSVGEPINPEAWRWYHHVVGEDRCPIVDTWWQTETGGILISAIPGVTPLKPGSATRPFFGVEPVVLDAEKGIELQGDTQGILALKRPWPGQMRTVFGDHKRFEETYFSQYKGYYFTGDGCKRDKDGYYWITGRVDDVLNVSGHRIGTAEVESALVSHHKVAEAAVVGMPHEIKGQGIYAFVTLKMGVSPTEELKNELIDHVKKEIGAFAAPDYIHWAPGLPKTRSGKIMRRILRKIASNDLENLGDTTALADPTVVENLIKG